jgi:glutaredoxin 3
MPKVEIYTTRFCPYCIAAKALLKRKSIAFTEIDIAGNWERRDEMIERANGRVTVPQVFIGAQHIGGNDDLQALDRAGKLDALLEHDPEKWAPVFGKGQSRT